MARIAPEELRLSSAARTSNAPRLAAANEPPTLVKVISMFTTLVPLGCEDVMSESRRMALPVMK
jgi:hypothetical protein